MVRRAARIDANQPEVVKDLRARGWSIEHTHTLGRGFPDLLASRRMDGIPWCCLIELKDGSKPASQRKLTKDEQDFAEDFRGPLIVAYDAEDADSKLWSMWGNFRQMMFLGKT